MSEEPKIGPHPPDKTIVIEKLGVTLKCSVRATRPLTERDWVVWELQMARRSLLEARRHNRRHEHAFTVCEAVSNALDHAIRAAARHKTGGRGGLDPMRLQIAFETAVDPDVVAVVTRAQKKAGWISSRFGWTDWCDPEPAPRKIPDPERMRREVGKALAAAELACRNVTRYCDESLETTARKL
jgi:hypothetical protein